MTFEIKDLTGLGAPVTKLIEVLSSGTGVVYKPFGIRREARAQADATRLIGNAQLEVDVTRARAITAAEASNRLVLAETAVQIEHRTQARIEHREVLRQGNLEAIAEAAASHLPKHVSPTPVDEDWKTRFFNIAEDVSSTKMQDLWGKILAGEVAQPGTYSIRTMEALRNISQAEAEAFRRLRYLALDTGHVLKAGPTDDLGELGLSFADVLSLREAGLLADSGELSLSVTWRDDKGFVVLGFNGQGLLIERMDKTVPVLSLSSYVLTRVGLQLLSLIEPQPNMEYLKKVAASHKELTSLYLGVPGAPRETFKKL